ncbi:MAG: CBS domain-containing protein [Myxococcota bacterium]
MRLAEFDRMPPVGVAMTPFPYAVGPDASVLEVEQLMEEHGIRHVPVQEDGHVLGIVSERDLHHLVHSALPKGDKRRLRVRHLLLSDVYSVEMSTPLAEVATEMARRHIGSAIVLRQGRLAGVFSAVDACRLLAEFLEDRFHPGEPEGAA